MLQDLIFWFDRHPAVYWWVGCAFLAWHLGEVLSPAGIRRSGPAATLGSSGVRYVLSLGLLLLAWRWPYLFYAGGMSPDESQQIAGALTLVSDPVFWRSVDGHTAGPVNFYALALPALLGLPVDYLSARALALGFVFAALLCAYSALRRGLDRADARAGMLPGVLFFSFAVDWDFLHVSTEHVPIALLSGSAAALGAGVAAKARHSSAGWCALSGLLAGLVPWAKLQGLPAALAIGGVAAFCLTMCRAPAAPRWAPLLGFGLGFGLPSIGFGAMIWSSGQWEVFADGYLTGNASYVRQGDNIIQVATGLWRMAAGYGTYPALLLVCILAGIAGVLPLVRHRSARATYTLSAAAVSVSFFLIFAPRRIFLHYLLFSVLPLTAFAAAGVAEWRRGLAATGGRRLVIAFAVVAAGVHLAVRLSEPLPFMLRQMQRFTRTPQTEVAARVLEYSKPGDKLGIWGWNPQYHVETQLPQATREAHTQRVMQASELQGKLQRRYVDDLKSTQPAIFIDAVGEGAFAYTDRRTDGHEVLPALRAYIAEHYRLAADLTVARIYVRRDRAAELGHVKARSPEYAAPQTP